MTTNFNRPETLSRIERILGAAAREGAERLSDTALRDLLLNAMRGVR